MTATCLAQQEPVFVQGFKVLPALNPSFTGKEKGISLHVLSRVSSSKSFEDIQSSMFYAGSQLSQNNGYIHSVGFKALSDRVEDWQVSTFTAQYSLRKRWTDVLETGVGATLDYEQVKMGFAWLPVHDNDPKQSQGEQKGESLDVGLGLYGHWKEWEVGLSVSHMMTPTISGKKGDFFTFNRGYFVNVLHEPYVLPNAIRLKPHAMIWLSRLSTLALIGSEVAWSGISGGLFYKSDKAIVLRAEIKFKNGLVAGYAMDLPVSSVRHLTNEFLLSYPLNIDLKNKKTRKSIRYL